MNQFSILPKMDPIYFQVEIKTFDNEILCSIDRLESGSSIHLNIKEYKEWILIISIRILESSLDEYNFIHKLYTGKKDKKEVFFYSQKKKDFSQEIVFKSVDNFKLTIG